MRIDSVICPSDSRKAEQVLRLKPDNPIRGRPDVRGSGLTPGASLQIMTGESPYQMQVIEGARADRRGRVDVAVDLPEWPRPD